MTSDGKLEFINPTTGDIYKVAPRHDTIELALKLGYLPATDKDDDAVDSVMTP